MFLRKADDAGLILVLLSVVDYFAFSMFAAGSFSAVSTHVHVCYCRLVLFLPNLIGRV